MPKLHPNVINHTTGSSRENAEFLLNYKIGNKEGKLLNKLLHSQPTTLEEWKSSKQIFRASVLLYLISSSETDALKEYLLKCRQLKLTKDEIRKLSVRKKWLNQYQIGCNCTTCYGACLELVEKYSLIY